MGNRLRTAASSSIFTPLSSIFRYSPRQFPSPAIRVSPSAKKSDLISSAAAEGTDKSSICRQFCLKLSPEAEIRFCTALMILDAPSCHAHNLVHTCRQFHLGDRVFADQSSQQKHWTLPEVVQRLRGAYCGTLTAEFMHLGSE